ncbi:hypothetical protein [Streptomyces sp. ISL-94]|uniref:hypothetical protein n=1 Tax=Streptomyces sp. ISL-94 TaxID=2819190 RepID=UPI001BEB7AB3|nr:hypothetical protein [Streptomyces sp. ISL-94]MBT2479573.1 hypothetical protein [Streptomyces sp. ISL-94]
MTIPPAIGTFAGQAAASVKCPKGEVRTGGGALVTAGNSHADRYPLGASIPQDGEGWWAFASNSDPSAPGKIQAYVICAKVASVTTLTTP